MSKGSGKRPELIHHKIARLNHDICFERDPTKKQRLMAERERLAQDLREKGELFKK